MTTMFPHGRWLLCPSTYFDVTYEINPWMSIQRSPMPVAANQQWRMLHHTLIRLGVDVRYVDPVQGLPDLVFTANAGLVKGKQVIISRFRYPERKGEEPVFSKWFSDRGFEIHQVTKGDFEGEGDALFAGEKLFGGYGFRSDQSVYDEIAKLFQPSEMILCEMVNPRFYHLDTCFCPISDSAALFHRDAFAPESITRMEKHIELIEVPKDDAERFVCNAVVLGSDIVMPSGCDKTYDLLRKRGITCHGVELNEFLKGGGSAKCLSLKLERGLGTPDF
ncbi:MAG: hypothetical protein KDD62_06665 [Bdellovibrionales bacterium]|nr:hypothetical protein [Bdellovibrionales bacterium]